MDTFRFKDFLQVLLRSLKPKNIIKMKSIKVFHGPMGSKFDVTKSNARY